MEVEEIQSYKEMLDRACRYLKKTSGRTQTEGPRRILSVARKCIGTEHLVNLSDPYIKRRLAEVGYDS